MLTWKNLGGFSIDASVRIAAGNSQAMARLLRYVARPPIILNRLLYDPKTGQVTILSSKALYHQVAQYNVLEFLALLSLHAPERKTSHPIRRFLRQPVSSAAEKKASQRADALPNAQPTASPRKHL